MNTCLVIPTIRQQHLRDFLAAWGERGGWDHLILIEDAPELSGLLGSWGGKGGDLRQFSHKEIAAILGEDAWIISRRNSACRVFGFLAAWWAGYDAVLTLDDDCYPLPGCTDLVGEHRHILDGHPVWAESIPNVRMRGLPYRNRGRLQHVKVNVGLWTRNADLDAPCALVNGDAGYAPPAGSRIIPSGQLVPWCGMHVFALREAIPLLFQPPMGEGRPYDRFEDIWGGVIAKTVMDRLGWHLAMGAPFVEHRRASDPFVNLRKEAAGIGANELLWGPIHGSLVGGTDALGGLRGLGEALARQLPLAEFPAELRDYARDIGRALLVWVRLLTERPRGL
jgi:reversibly glycosylated polypeptide/UDP-arabinopyranose mutase